MYIVTRTVTWCCTPQDAVYSETTILLNKVFSKKSEALEAMSAQRPLDISYALRIMAKYYNKDITDSDLLAGFTCEEECTDKSITLSFISNMEGIVLVVVNKIQEELKYVTIK